MEREDEVGVGMEDTEGGSIKISFTKSDGVTWTKVLKGWWLAPTAFAVVFGIPMALCFVGALIGRS